MVPVSVVVMKVKYSMWVFGSRRERNRTEKPIRMVAELVIQFCGPLR